MRIIKPRAWEKDRESYFEVVSIDYENKVTCLRNGCIRVWVGFDKVEFEWPTGLRDINDKIIYEGDKVRVTHSDGFAEDPDKHTVVYKGNTGYPAFDLDPHPGHEMNGLAYIIQSGEQEIEVVGNVHEEKIK